LRVFKKRLVLFQAQQLPVGQGLLIHEVPRSILIFMDPCIIDDPIEIPTRCSFVIEFIISKFIEGSENFPLREISTQSIFHSENFPLSLDNGRSPNGYINQRLQL